MFFVSKTAAVITWNHPNLNIRLWNRGEKQGRRGIFFTTNNMLKIRISPKSCSAHAVVSCFLFTVSSNLMTVYLMSTSAAVTHQVRFLNFIKSKNFNKAAFIMYYQATKIISIIIIRCMTTWSWELLSMMLQGIRIVSRVRIFSIKYHQDVWTITKMILNKTGKGRGINSNFASQKKKILFCLWENFQPRLEKHGKW